MSLSRTINKLRLASGLSQERLASVLNVSRQAVQKWENGTAQPDMDNIINLAKLFHISVDALVLGSNARIVECLAYDKKVQPELSALHPWEVYAEQLGVEYRQAVEEGLDIAQYKELFAAVEKMPQGRHKEEMADILFDIVRNAPTAGDYQYDEPSGLEEIRKRRTAYEFEHHALDEPALRKKIQGAWLGRICGCLLGKPIEGIRTYELVPILKEAGNYPMHRYLYSADITDDMCHKYQFRLRGNNWYPDQIDAAPSDDDTNYTVLAQLIVEQYGRDFTPRDVSAAWMDYQPKNAYCTAERVAFCNFIKGYTPPNSAIYKNPFREWIGAQIRGDYFGYINPGNPELAAEMAWRDASISHVKNGIYGEMMVAAMIACAAVAKDMEDIVRGGLAQIPAGSRLYEAVNGVLQGYKGGVSQKDCFKAIHRKYNEDDMHALCHTISNAMIVTAALLYGEGDYGRSICMAVETGFDTDCNGATVGSILGMRNGADGISEDWVRPLHNRLETSIFGVGTVAIDDLAEKTMRHIHTV